VATPGLHPSNYHITIYFAFQKNIALNSATFYSAVLFYQNIFLVPTGSFHLFAAGSHSISSHEYHILRFRIATSILFSSTARKELIEMALAEDAASVLEDFVQNGTIH